MDRKLIEKFDAAASSIRSAVAGLTSAQLKTRCEPGLWSIQEVVVHLTDGDAIGIDRMKRVIAEDNPSLLCADETAYNDTLHPHEQSLDDALLQFEVSRRQFARVLRLLPDDAFRRIGTHNVAGELTLADLLQTYVDHVDHHLKFVAGKRERLTSVTG
jgi:uncharacterized damage-inducible protein DinB